MYLEDPSASIAKQLWLNTRFCSRSLDFQTMFVGTSQEYCFLTFHHMPPLLNVRKDHSVQMANMRGSIDIENRRGYVVGLLGGGRCRCKAIVCATRFA